MCSFLDICHHLIGSSTLDTLDLNQILPKDGKKLRGFFIFYFYYLKNIPDEVASTLIKEKLMGNIRVLKERERERDRELVF